MSVKHTPGASKMAQTVAPTSPNKSPSMQIIGVQFHRKTTFVGLEKKTMALNESIKLDLNTFKTNAVQIFTHNPQNGKAIATEDAEIKATAELIAETKSTLVVHGPYNLLKYFNDPSLIEAKLPMFEQQFVVAKAFKSIGIVFHIGINTVEQVVNAMKHFTPLAKKYGVPVLLESIAIKSRPGITYEQLDQVNKLTEILGPNNKSWGWCIDTAHLWALGVDVKNFAPMENWLNGVKHPQKIQLFHLNGSARDKGTGRDEHETPFCAADKIWKGTKPVESGLAAVANFAKVHSVPIILELKHGNVDEINDVLDIIDNL